MVCLIAAIAIFYTATVRPGHVWGDDFAMYVHHAQNIVEGRPYADTGYIFNPLVPAYSPGMYPPIFPLLLVPLYRLFGLNLLPMKIEQIAFFLLTLATVYIYWRRDLGSGYAVALIAILGFSPVFWAAKDSVLSDLPFLFFFYLAALAVKSAKRDGRHWLPWSILLGLSLYLATSTRTAGIALVAGFALYDLLRYRTITRFGGVAVGLGVGLLVLQSRLLGSAPGAYMGQVHAITMHTVFANVLAYLRVLAGFWVASVRNVFAFFVLAIAALLMLSGMWHQSKRGFTIIEAFLLPYLGILLLWPFAAGIRAVFPFIPWIVFLALSGLRTLSEKLVRGYSPAAAWGFLLLVAIPYAQAYRAMDFGPILESQGLPEFRQLCEAVGSQTGSEDVFIFYRARVLSLYTGRPASTYSYRGTEAEMWEYAQKIHAAYLITTSAFEDDNGFLSRYVQDHATSLDLTYQNAKFRMYRIRRVQDSATAPDPRLETQSN